MPQEWVSLERLGFPDYSVSNWGIIRNDKTGRHLSQTKNNNGQMKVGLVGADKNRYTVEVSRLVAIAFELPGEDDLNNSLIHLDGNKEHTYLANLAWRPRWFALQYHRQFVENKYFVDREVKNVTTGEIFNNSREAVVKYGILEKHLMADLVNGRGFFPHHHIYQLCE